MSVQDEPNYPTTAKLLSRTDKIILNAHWNEQRMLEKLTRSLTEDIGPLLAAGVRFSDDDAMLAFESVWTQLIARINGDPWKLTEKVIEELRTKRYPELLQRK